MIENNKEVISIFKCSACGEDHSDVEVSHMKTQMWVNDMWYCKVCFCPKTNIKVFISPEDEYGAFYHATYK
jgi:hypothetical protein